MEIRKYTNNNFYDLVSCMEGLQDFIVDIDNLKINIRSPEYGMRYSKKLLEDIEKNEGIIYMVYIDAEIAGCMASIIEYSTQDDAYEILPLKIGRVIELFVFEKFRGNKIGKELITIAESYFVEKSCNMSRIEVFGPNIGALDFYHKQDYQDRMIDLCKMIKP